MTYFLTEERSDGEQIRFAVSDPGDPTRWHALNGGGPVLISTVGEHGVRDPFILRDVARNCWVIIATDLRVHDDGDWTRAVRHGSDSIVVWESADLVRWSGPQLRRIAPAGAGNTWAPKVIRDEDRDCWVVIWAAAVYGGERSAQTHQRLLCADTRDFETFSAARVYFDPGHDVIDATFLRTDQGWFRFSANAHAPDNPPDRGHHIFVERGMRLDDPEFVPVAVDVGRDVMVRGEGPAVFESLDGAMSYLLIDEHGFRGYQLFELPTADLATGRWRHLPDAALPSGARHGSVVPISVAQRAALLEVWS